MHFYDAVASPRDINVYIDIYFLQSIAIGIFISREMGGAAWASSFYMLSPTFLRFLFEVLIDRLIIIVQIVCWGFHILCYYKARLNFPFEK